jgi:hypothetical protein
MLTYGNAAGATAGTTPAHSSARWPQPQPKPRMNFASSDILDDAREALERLNRAKTPAYQANPS